MPASKFDKIFADLQSKIEGGEYDFGTLLPSENKLTQIYGASRGTVRRALAQLIRRGYIQTHQGSPVRVIYEPAVRNFFRIGGIESFQEAAQRNGFAYDTEVVKLEKKKADGKISSRTGFQIGDELYDVRRIRYIDGRALIFDKNYFLASAVGELTEEIAKQSIYEHLENTLHLRISTGKRKMTVELATTEDKQYLEIENYNCLLVVSSRIFSLEGIQFEYTESRHHPEFFCFEDTVTR